MTEAEVQKYLDENQELESPPSLEQFDAYAKEHNPSQLEWDLAHFITIHKSGLIRKILASHNTAYYLFPPSLFDIYLDNYAANIVTIVKQEINSQFNLNPEEINLIVTKEWLTMLLGDKFLIPPINYQRS